MTLKSLIDPAAIAAMIGLFGAVLAALLASAGYLYRAQVEHRKGKRRVLYFLLEIRYAAATALFDPRKAAAAYHQRVSEQIAKRGLPLSDEPMPEEARAVLVGLFDGLVSEARRDLIEKLVVPYEAALLDMAAIDPVTAHRLRGKDQIERLMGHLKEYRDQCTTSFFSEIADAHARRALDWITSEATEHALAELEKLLREDVLTVAATCGRSDLRRCKEVLSRSLPARAYQFEGLDEYLDTMITKFTNNLQGATSTSPRETAS